MENDRAVAVATATRAGGTSDATGLRCMRTINAGKHQDMAPLPPRSQQLVEATPINKVRTGVRTVVELTAYPDGHANIAVGSVDSERTGAMAYRRVDNLPLNHRNELEAHIAAILDQLFDKSMHES
jgi:hypothetical protein